MPTLIDDETRVWVRFPKRRSKFAETFEEWMREAEGVGALVENQ
jgi:hypothetical protein